MTLSCPDCGAVFPLAFILDGVLLACQSCGHYGPVCPSIQEAGADWDKMDRSCGGGA